MFKIDKNSTTQFLSKWSKRESGRDIVICKKNLIFNQFICQKQRIFTQFQWRWTEPCIHKHVQFFEIFVYFGFAIKFWKISFKIFVRNIKQKFIKLLILIKIFLSLSILDLKNEFAQYFSFDCNIFEKFFETWFIEFEKQIKTHLEIFRTFSSYLQTFHQIFFNDFEFRIFKRIQNSRNLMCKISSKMFCDYVWSNWYICYQIAMIFGTT